MEPKKYKFVKDPDGRWYIDIPEWTGSRADLEMVMGADDMLNNISTENEVWLYMSTEPFTVSEIPDASSFPLLKIMDTPEYGGAMYRINEMYGVQYNKEVWLCDVVRFVFDGNLPDVIHVR